MNFKTIFDYIFIINQAIKAIKKIRLFTNFS